VVASCQHQLNVDASYVTIYALLLLLLSPLHAEQLPVGFLLTRGNGSCFFVTFLQSGDPCDVASALLNVQDYWVCSSTRSAHLLVGVVFERGGGVGLGEGY
jgi:hypothetical protein